MGVPLCWPCAQPLSLPRGHGTRMRCQESAPGWRVLAEGFWWHTHAVPSVPAHGRGQEKVGVSFPTCRWGLGGSSASDEVIFFLTNPLGSQPSAAPACANGLVGLSLCSSPQMLHAISISRELISLLHFFSLSLQALWKSVSCGVWSHRPCPVQDRRVAKSEDRSGPGPLPLPPECAVVQPGSWLWRVSSLWSLVERSPLTPVFFLGESQGQSSLVGCCLWGCTESDMTEAT